MHVVWIDPWIYGAGLAALMNLALLWVCGRILHLPVSWWRITTSASIGGIYQFWLGIRWELGSVFAWEWGVFLLIGVVMCCLTYPSRHIFQLIRGIFLFYFLTFMTVGISMGAMALVQLAGGRPLQTWQFIGLNLGALMIVAEMGWGMIHEAVWTRTHMAEINIEWGERSIRVKALLDTGNLLKDPLTQRPVMVVSLQAVQDQLLIKEQVFFQQLIKGEMPETVEYDWQTRVRFLPFRTVGDMHGLLVGLNVDSLELRTPVQKKIQPAIVGFTAQKFPSGDYQAIFPAVLIGEMTPIYLKEAK